MTRRIRDYDEARRLAEQVVSDLRLYSGASSTIPPDAIAEARGLYQSRVEDAHHALFDEALAAPSSAHPSAGNRPFPMVALVVAIVVVAGAVWLLLGS